MGALVPWGPKGPLVNDLRAAEDFFNGKHSQDLGFRILGLGFGVRILGLGLRV